MACRCTRLPHRISRAYSVSSSGPRTLRTCVDPIAGLMVRRIYPRLPSRVDTDPPGCRHVLVEQLGHVDGRVGLPPGPGHGEQLAELDLRGPLGLAGLAEPDLPAGERVGSGAHRGAPGPT